MNNKVLIRSLIAGIIILSIALIALVIVYFATDSLKPANQLFSKYLRRDLATINKIIDLSEEENYIALLKEKNYNDNTNITIDYLNNVESKETFNISATGSTDNQNKNSFRNIGIKYNDNTDITNLEFLQENQLYGVLFSDIVGQYVSIDMSNQEQTLNNLNIDKTKIDDFINKYKIKDILQLLGDARNQVETTILNYKENINNNQYSSQKNRVITLSNQSSVTTKAFTLKLTSDQTKKLIREVLKQLGEQEVVNQINSMNEDFPELTATLYEQDGKTVRIALEAGKVSMRVDIYENEINVYYSYTNNEELQEININYINSNEVKKITYQDNKNNNVTLSINTNLTETGGEAVASLVLKTENIKDIQIRIQQKIELSDNIQIEKKFENVPNVNITTLESGTVNTALSSLFGRINSKLGEIQNNNINSEFIDKWMELNNKIQLKYQTLQNNRENKFNNQFLLYQGTNVEKSIIYNLLDVVGRNIYGYRVNSKNEIKIYLQEGNVDTSISDKLKEIVKNAKGNYNVNFEFDNNGKLSIILLEQYKKQ